MNWPVEPPRAASEGDGTPAPLGAGRNWRYCDGYLINEFLGRVGHTPAWIVEVEGREFNRERPSALRERWRSLWSTPRMVQRNYRRLAFAWPLIWPPPEIAERQRMVEEALSRARRLGPPTTESCGVCRRAWEGGPTLVRGRARHLCPVCAESIEEDRRSRPPGTMTTWLWCLVAGVAGLLLQMLFHQTWTVLPLAVVAGWLMGTANGPNFDRHPVLSPALTIALLLLFQLTGSTLITGAQLGHLSTNDLGRIFVLTLASIPAGVLAGSLAGTLGLFMAILEKRLQQA